MRDPLRNVSVRYKLALTFFGVCLLAFGVGGYLISRSAMQALEREIYARLEIQAESYASALEADLRSLRQRARDFASDGYIRTGFARLLSGDTAGVDGLRTHLVDNKLPIVPAFANLELVGPSAQTSLVAVGEAPWRGRIDAEAIGDVEWCSGWVEIAGSARPPGLLLSVPLLSLAGDRRIGSLVVEVHAARWIADSVAGMRGGGAATIPELTLEDRAGRRLVIPPELVSRPPPRVGGELVRNGFGMQFDEPQTHRTRGLFVRHMPLDSGNWTLRTQVESREALRAVSGFQVRMLVIGGLLSLAACALLVFPMQFFVRPLHALHTAARRIGRGDFSARVATDESGDEIGELSRSFNLMADAVEERAAKLQMTADALEQRQEELRTERDRLNAVILSMRDGLMVLDADGKPQVWNAAARPLMSIAQSEQAGEPGRSGSARSGASLRAHRVCLESACAEGEGRLVSADGDSVTRAEGATGEASRCARCLFDPAQPPRSCLVDVDASVYEVHSTRLAAEPSGRSGRVLVARDVTDRVVQDERQIHHERLAVLGEVAAVVAHELNNPLAAIKMFTQMVTTKLPADSQLHEDLSVIERNTRACTRTIRELLDYATGATPEVGPVDVHATLEDVAQFLRAVRKRVNTELELQLEAGDPFVVGDEVQLRQVFVNLIMNAVQAAGDQGGRIVLRTWIEASHLVVDVQDDGPGIPDEVRESVFKPFYTTKRRGAGTGLGLSTARRITEIQGGGLELVDARPQHTTFRVRLLRGET